MNFLRKAASAAGHYLLKFAVAEDEAGNVLFTNGPLDETISTHAQRAADAGSTVGKIMTAGLHVFQKGHGKIAQQDTIKDAEKVIAIEKADPKEK